MVDVAVAVVVVVGMRREVRRNNRVSDMDRLCPMAVVVVVALELANLFCDFVLQSFPLPMGSMASNCLVCRCDCITVELYCCMLPGL